jgi:cyanophycinase
MNSHGRIGLVGSGEYLPVMHEFEAMMLAAGPSNRYLQLATAAGRESAARLKYWEELGAQAAKRLGAEQIFLPVFNREDAMNEEFAKMIDGAGLIYLSGGDPHYLAQSLRQTPIWEAIERNWRAGSSLAGCSAGAMAMGADIPNFRKMKAEGEAGFDLIGNIRTIPHYNKFFRWIGDSAAELFLRAPEGVSIIGIDEGTAIWSDDLTTWNVQGTDLVHVIKGVNPGKYHAGELVVI